MGWRITISRTSLSPIVVRNSYGKVFTYIFLVITFSCQTNKTKSDVSHIPVKQVVIKIDSAQKLKFTSPIDYNKYPAHTFTGKRAQVNFSSNPYSRRFHSAIKFSIKRFGINFAGRYNLATWGCGTGCQSGVITDLSTGKVYNIPSATGYYDFKSNSRLLVVNPPDSNANYNICRYCEPELWIWNTKERKFKKLK